MKRPSHKIESHYNISTSPTGSSEAAPLATRSFSAAARVVVVLACLCSPLLHGCGRISQQTRDSESEDRGGLASLVKFTDRFKLPTRKPSHHRLWRADLSVLPYAEISSDRVVLNNIRDCEYRTEDDYDVHYFDREIMLDTVQSVDFIVVPFKNTPALAHTMISFGLSTGEHFVFSVEARLEKNENYSAFASSNKEYELIWLVGTERDLIRLRTNVRKVDVYLYPTNATPEQSQKAFLAAVARVNEIARTPEHYDLLTNNCTTNIVDLVNSLRPGAIPNDIRVVLPGHSDRMAYDLGLLAVPRDQAGNPMLSFEQVRAASRINLKSILHSDSSQFSDAIRGR